MEKILCTPTFYSLLLQPKCFSISISNDPYILLILLSPALTSVLPYMHESSHMCSGILLSRAPIPVLLLIYQQCSMYSKHSTIFCSDCISSPHARDMSCVLQSFYSLLLRPQCFCTSSMFSNYLISPVLIAVLLHMYEPSPMCCNILFSPAPTQVLLHIYQ